MLSIELISKIDCVICKKAFYRITNTHLWKEHRITVDEYKQTYPDALLDAPGLADMRVQHLKGKTYDEIYGVEKSTELKSLRSEDAIEQMQDLTQITIRKELCGYSHTEEQKLTQSTQKTVHGGNTYRKRALTFYGLECGRCGYTSDEEHDFHVHHIDLVNVGVELADHSLTNLQVLCASCHTKYHKELEKLSKHFVGQANIEKGIHYVFKGLKDFGLDLNDENFKDTPKRVARAYLEIFEGISETNSKIKSILTAAFPCDLDQMVVARDIKVFSMCPHHLLPVDYTIHVGYIPTKNVVGLSKLARIVQLLSRRPILQEKLVDDITSALMQIDGCLGAGCISIGRHYCMIMRGIQQIDSYTTVSSLKGAILNDASAKEEFLELTRRN